MKYISLILLLFLCFKAKSQKIDTVIDMHIYKSYFNYSLKEPIFVVYVLYHGGGECNRQGLVFHHTDFSATDEDYLHAKELNSKGFDKGHLANAEDFANDCDFDKNTFWYFNCVPQTPNLNRGIWKHDETEMRKISQQDSLLIIAGSIFSDKKIGAIGVPDSCYKIVQDLKTKKIILCRIYSNTNNAELIDVSLGEIERRTKINFEVFLKK